MLRRQTDRAALHPDELYEEIASDSNDSDDDSKCSSSCTDEHARVIVNYWREIRSLRENIRRCDLYLKSSKDNATRKGSFSSRQNNVRMRRKSRALFTKNSSSVNEAEHLQERLRRLNYELLSFRNRFQAHGANMSTTINRNCNSFFFHDENALITQPNVLHPVSYAGIHDLINLPSPLTEDAVIRTLHARFYSSKYQTMVGPILLSVNPYKDIANSLNISDHESATQNSQFLHVIQAAMEQQFETGLAQTFVLSGSSGSGKTYHSMIILSQLFNIAGGGCETDAFKRLVAAFTVLRSLGNAKTMLNSESSRMGHFIEVQMTNGAIYRTKIHCYFLDHTRVVRPLPKEKNYHIFYQMLAGLSTEERTKLNLNGYSIQNFHYLGDDEPIDNQNEKENSSRFENWKICLSVLGIPFFDVVRVLAAVLLLGNIHFIQRNEDEVEVQGNNEIKAVALLLGISPTSLFRCLISQSHNVHGQLIKTVCNADVSNAIRDSLAKALYCRTVATIVRRANSLKNVGSLSGIVSSDSYDSMHNQTGRKCSMSMSILNTTVNCSTNGFIGILDMFGFEAAKPSRLEHLCINLCAETMQHFYNTHIFKSSLESCKDEGIKCDLDIHYEDNVPCIDLISSFQTGLLSMLDAECVKKGTADTYIQKVKLQHKNNVRFDVKLSDYFAFGIQHFAGKVVYNVKDFIEVNRDVIEDDVIVIFHKEKCNFGFATHLFITELKFIACQAEGLPCGMAYRIAPTSSTELQNENKPISTLTSDFHTRLDNLLKTLVHSKPHFIRCIRANDCKTRDVFDRDVVMHQIRALQVLETVNLMTTGFPHKMRFKLFVSRYKCLVPFKKMQHSQDKVIDNGKLILEYFSQQLKTYAKRFTSNNLWIIGSKHIFLTELARQQLEINRSNKRHWSAKLIQTVWRCCNLRDSSQLLKRNIKSCNSHPNKCVNRVLKRPRPEPLAVMQSSDFQKCDPKFFYSTYSTFGLDWKKTPPVPPSRSYTVVGNLKFGYPQKRIMSITYQDDANGGQCLRKGEDVTVVGTSSQRGHLLVHYKNYACNVPYQFTELNINI